MPPGTLEARITQSFVDGPRYHDDKPAEIGLRGQYKRLAQVNSTTAEQPRAARCGQPLRRSLLGSPFTLESSSQNFSD